MGRADAADGDDDNADGDDDDAGLNGTAQGPPGERLDACLAQCLYCLYGVELQQLRTSACQREVGGAGALATPAEAAELFATLRPYAESAQAKGRRREAVKLRAVMERIATHFPAPPPAVAAQFSPDPYLDASPGMEPAEEEAAMQLLLSRPAALLPPSGAAPLADDAIVTPGAAAAAAASAAAAAAAAGRDPRLAGAHAEVPIALYWLLSAVTWPSDPGPAGSLYEVQLVMACCLGEPVPALEAPPSAAAAAAAASAPQQLQAQGMQSLAGAVSPAGAAAPGGGAGLQTPDAAAAAAGSGGAALAPAGPSAVVRGSMEAWGLAMRRQVELLRFSLMYYPRLGQAWQALSDANEEVVWLALNDASKLVAVPVWRADPANLARAAQFRARVRRGLAAAIACGMSPAAEAIAWSRAGTNALEPLQSLPPEFDQWRVRPPRDAAWERRQRAALAAFGAAARLQPEEWEHAWFQGKVAAKLGEPPRQARAPKP